MIAHGNGSAPPEPKLLDEFILGDFAVRRYAFTPQVHLARHTHERPSLIAVLRGGYTGTMPCADYEACHGELVLVPPGIAHSDTVGHEGAGAIFIIPSDDCVDGLHPEFFEKVRRFRGRPLSMLQHRIDRELRTEDAMSRLAAEGALIELVAMVGRLNEVRETAHSRWLAKVRDRLDDDVEAPPSMAALVNDAGVSRAHLSRTFRRVFGCSIGQYVRRRRVDRAARLLCDTDQPLAEIALACGFYDQSHLCRLVRYHMNATPAEIRNSRTPH